MLLPTPTQFILFELDLNVKFPLLCLLHFLSDLKGIILRVLKKRGSCPHCIWIQQIDISRIQTPGIDRFHKDSSFKHHLPSYLTSVG